MSRTALTEILHRQAGPLYRQAADRLRAAIVGGQLGVGLPLPTEADLAQGFGVSLITVRAALRELEGEGLIRKRAAKTAVVASAVPRSTGPRELNSLEDIAAATTGARLEVASYRPARSAEAARSFGLDGRTMLPCLRARMLLGDLVLSDITIYFPPEIGRRLVREDFDDVVVFRTLERRLGIRIAGAQISVSAQVADAALAATLEIAEGDAVMASRMLCTDQQGAPVELTLARHRADRYSLAFAVSRN